MAGCPDVEVFIVGVGTVPAGRGRRRGGGAGVEFGAQRGDDLGLSGCLRDGERGVVDGGVAGGGVVLGVLDASPAWSAGRVVDVEWLCGGDVGGGGLCVE